MQQHHASDLSASAQALFPSRSHPSLSLSSQPLTLWLWDAVGHAPRRHLIYATHPPHHIRAATVVSSKGTQQYLSHRGVVKVTLLGAYAVPPLGVAPVAPLALHMPHAHTLMQHDAR